jgi:hypothetical protein
MQFIARLCAKCGAKVWQVSTGPLKKLTCKNCDPTSGTAFRVVKKQKANAAKNMVFDLGLSDKSLLS